MEHEFQILTETDSIPPGLPRITEDGGLRSLDPFHRRVQPDDDFLLIKAVRHSLRLVQGWPHAKKNFYVHWVCLHHICLRLVKAER